MAVHELKCETDSFRVMSDGMKPFLVAHDERGYAEGDTLLVREFDPGVREAMGFTGRCLELFVTYVLRGFNVEGRHTTENHGLRGGYCVMGFRIQRRMGFGSIRLPVEEMTNLRGSAKGGA